MDPSGHKKILDLADANKPGAPNSAQKEMMKFVELLRQYGVKEELLVHLEEEFLKPIGPEAQLAKDKFSSEDLTYFFSTRAELAEIGVQENLDEKVLGELGRAIFVAELVRTDPMLAVKLADALPTKKYNQELGNRLQKFLRKHILTEHSPVTGSLVREFAAENTFAETGLLAGVLDLYLKYDNFNTKRSLIDKITDTASNGHPEISDLSRSKMTRQQVELLREQAAEYSGPAIRRKPSQNVTPPDVVQPPVQTNTQPAASTSSSPASSTSRQKSNTRSSSSSNNNSRQDSDSSRARVRTHSILDLPIIDPSALGRKTNPTSQDDQASTTHTSKPTPSVPAKKLHPILGIEMPDESAVKKPSKTPVQSTPNVVPAKEDTSKVHPTLGLKIVEKTAKTPDTGDTNKQVNPSPEQGKTEKRSTDKPRVHPVLGVPMIEKNDVAANTTPTAVPKKVKMHPIFNIPMKDDVEESVDVPTESTSSANKADAKPKEEPKKVHGILGLPIVDKEKK